MSEPARIDLHIETGASWTLTIEDDDGVPVDLTGATVTAEVWTKPGGTLLCTLTPTLTDPAEGEFQLDAPTTEAQFGWTRGLWELVIENSPLGTVAVIAHGEASHRVSLVLS